MRYGLLLLVGLLGSAQALELSDEELEERGWAAEAETGFTNTTGNSETTAFRGRLELDAYLQQWRNNLTLESDYKKDSGETSQERYFVAYQANRDWTEHSYTFGNLSYENDRFNGLESMWTGVAGFGFRVYPAPKWIADFEFGPGYRRNKADSVDGEYIFRGLAKAEWELSSTSTFKQELTTDAGEENTITRLETSLTANIIESLAMKLAFNLTHQTNPAADDDDDTKENLDTATALTLLYRF